MHRSMRQGGRKGGGAGALLAGWFPGWVGRAPMAVVVFAALTLGWVYVVGKDLNWDYVNYHHYGAALMLEDRWQQDYFAASVQSYLNPLAFLPLYWMVTAHWPSWLIVVTLSIAHSLNLVVVWRLVVHVVPSTWPEAARRTMQWLGLGLGFVAPMHLTLVGSSFSDATASLPVMLALYLLLTSPTLGLRTFALAGLLIGVATGLKLTNAAMALGVYAAGLTMWVGARPFSMLITRTAVMGLAALLGLVLTHGYWGWKLYLEFGNPLFPLFNAIFQSPDFAFFNFQDRRFLETGFLGLLRLPFELAAHKTWIYSEIYMPDVRVAALALLLMAVGGVLLVWRRDLFVKVPRPLVGLTIFFVVGFIGWGMTTRIGRYAYPLWILIGPLLVGWFVILCPTRSDLATASVAAVLALQLLVQYEAGTVRWSSFEWTDEWISIEVPARLKREPVNLVTIGHQPFGVLAPHLHPASGVINIIGQYVQPSGDAMTDRLKRLLSDDSKPLNLLIPSSVEPKLDVDLRLPKASRASIDVFLGSYGLSVADATCDVVVMREAPLAGSIFQTMPLKHNGKKRDAVAYYLVCPLKRLPEEQAKNFYRLANSMNSVFGVLEKKCPELFSPPDMQTLLGAGSWQRHYPNTLNKMIIDGDLVALRASRQMRDLVMGRVADFSSGEALDSFRCPVLPDPLASEQ